MRKKNILYILLLALATVNTKVVFAQAPQITGWSSNGSGAANPQDIMYLVTQGEAITFSITVDQTVDYEWYVNKVIDSLATDSTFTWTVPNEKNIWEMHIRVYNFNGEDHMEWVVSTLNVNEAPSIFDCFADGKYENRVELDPWDRPLPEWIVEMGEVDASTRILRASVLSGAIAKISTPINSGVGTWRYKYSWPDGAGPYQNTYILANMLYLESSHGTKLRLENPVDGHWWIDYLASATPRVPHAGYIINMVGSQILPVIVTDTIWHEIELSRDYNGYIHSWIDSFHVRWSGDKNDDLIDVNKFAMLFYDGTPTPLQYPLFLDDFHIYDTFFSSYNRIYYDTVKSSIVVEGFGNTLAEIAECISPTYFTYDSITNTAICKTDLTLEYGSELIISGETLKMDCSYNGERKIKYYTDAMFKIFNSTITTTGNTDFSWARMSDIIRFGTSSDACLKNTFKVINSTINNCSGLHLERPICLYLENANFTNLTGNHPIQVYFRWPLKELTIKNCRFVGKTGDETILLQGGDQFCQLIPKPVGMDIIDTKFENITFLRSKDIPYYLSPGEPGGTANLINCKLDDVSFNGTMLRSKYYLDVKVVDMYGDPISGAEVIVRNEQDNVNYPAENLSRGMVYLRVGDQISANGDTFFLGQQSNWFKGFADVNDDSIAITGVDGHTLLPSDTANTFVITGHQSNGMTDTFYTYTVKATYNIFSDSVVGVNPDTLWYRANPDSYPGVPERGTITITLPVGINEESNEDLSQTYTLFQNYPNPFRSSTQIDYTLPERSEVELSIYNVLGEKIKVLVEEIQGPGYCSIIWDGRDDSEKEVASGIYFYQLRADDYVATKKILILR